MNYIIYDLEATCWEGSRWEEMEIIEIGAVLLDGEHFQPMAEFEQFVRHLRKTRVFLLTLINPTRSRNHIIMWF